MSDMKMYNILGAFNNVDPKMTPVKEQAKTETVYESVEPRGSITEAVKGLEEKYMGFKKTVAAIKKGGSAENPEAVAAAIGRKKYGKKKFQKAAAAGKKLGEAAKPDFLDVDKDGDKAEPFKKAVKDKKAKQVDEGQGPYELYNPKHPKFKANYEKYKAKHPDCTLAEFVAAMKKREAKMNEAAYDEPAAPDAAAIERRKRLQALKDKREEEGYGKDEVNTPIRKVAGKAYGGAAQKDDVSDLDEVAPPGKKAERMVKHIKKGYAKDGKLTKKEKGIAYATAWKAHNKGQVEEGATWDSIAANAKGLKAKLTNNPKDRQSAADAHTKAAKSNARSDFAGSYAQEKGWTAGAGPKANKHMDAAMAHQRKATQVGEGTEFKDIVANSKAELKKAKPAMVKESRVMEETDYFYEKVGKALAEKNPALDTSTGEFEMAVRKEMVAQGIPPNRARNILLMDEDFLSDVATSYAHCCKEVAECGAPMNSFVGGAEELDEIARLAGLPTKEAVYTETTDDERKLERYHELIRQGMDPDDAEVEVFNDEGDEELDEREQFQSMPKATATTPAAPTAKPGVSYDKSKLNPMREEEMEEGNEFSGALAKAKAAGAKEFEVDGKKYTVKEDVNVNISAQGEEDVTNLIRKLAGMPTVEKEVEVAEERDVEHTNTPREEVAGLDAAIPSGNDLHRAKKSYSDKPYQGDNPMAVEESLWKSYEAMINNIKE